MASKDGNWCAKRQVLLVSGKRGVGGQVVLKAGASRQQARRVASGGGCRPTRNREGVATGASGGVLGAHQTKVAKGAPGGGCIRRLARVVVEAGASGGE